MKSVQTKDAPTATMGGGPRNPAGNVPMGQQKPKPAQAPAASVVGVHQSGDAPKHPFGNLPSTVAQPSSTPGRS